MDNLTMDILEPFAAYLDHNPLGTAEMVLSSLSSACAPDRNDAIIGALELKPFAEMPGASTDLRDAHAALQRVAEGGTLILDHTYRRRIAMFADMIRAFRQQQEQLMR